MLILLYSKVYKISHNIIYLVLYKDSMKDQKEKQNDDLRKWCKFINQGHVSIPSHRQHPCWISYLGVTSVGRGYQWLPVWDVVTNV